MKYERKYHNNGQIWSEVPCINGKKHGIAKWYDFHGNLDSQGLFLHGEPIKQIPLNTFCPHEEQPT